MYRAISLVPIILLPQVIFSGAIIRSKDWFTQIFAVVFPTRWAMAALGLNIGLHAETIGGDRLFGNDYTYHGTLYSIYTGRCHQPPPAFLGRTGHAYRRVDNCDWHLPETKGCQGLRGFSTNCRMLPRRLQYRLDLRRTGNLFGIVTYRATRSATCARWGISASCTPTSRKC